METAIAALCSDPQWSELLEHRRGNADIFDLFSFRETQHSDLLAWCFDAREGHGQSDAIFRDFLLAVYEASSRDEPGDRIKGKGLTRDFVRHWTPARIMTTSFATAAFFREYSLPAANAREKDCKLDLLVVDTDNRFLIAVENKAGSRLTGEQLERYVRRVQERLLSRPVFANFEVAFVALDRFHDPETEQDEDFDGRWALLGYEWLSRAAKRAELSQKRGNKDSAIVLSYCRQQINYESEINRVVNKLSRSLAIKHKLAVEGLRNTRTRLRDPADWTRSTLDASEIEGQLLRLLMQNREASELLIDLPQIELLHAEVCEEAEHLDDDGNHDKRRVFVSYRPPTPVPSVDEWWPLYVVARLTNPRREYEEPEFRVSLMWHPNLVPDSERNHYVEMIRREFPGARKVLKKAALLERHEVTSIEAAKSKVLGILDRCESFLKAASRVTRTA